MSNKTHSPEAPVTGRREFIKQLAVGGSAAAVAALSGGAAASETAPAKDAAVAAEPAGYHVTPHILDYYKTVGM